MATKNGNGQVLPAESKEIVERPTANLTVVNQPGDEALRAIINLGIDLLERGMIRPRVADIVKAWEILAKHGGADADDYAKAIKEAMQKPIPEDSPLGRASQIVTDEDENDEEDDEDTIR